MIPIVFTSHITKIIEKRIHGKIKSIGSKLIETGYYQTGYKEGVSTNRKISLVIHKILNSSRSPTNRDIFILADIRKAFENVYRVKLWHILKIKKVTYKMLWLRLLSVFIALLKSLSPIKTSNLTDV